MRDDRHGDYFLLLLGLTAIGLAAVVLVVIIWGLAKLISYSVRCHRQRIRRERLLELYEEVSGAERTVKSQ